MKIKIVFFIIAFVGCSNPTNTYVPFVVITPGTFIGTWTLDTLTSNGFLSTTNSCTALVKAPDSTGINITITNDSTKEVLFLNGVYEPFVDNHPPYYVFYQIHDISSGFGKIDTISDSYIDALTISRDADTLNYLTYRRGINKLSITCNRR